MPGAHVYVDETKSRGLVLVACSVPSTEVQSIRKEIRKMVLQGQRRIHFFKEADGRRKKILDMLGELPLASEIYETPRVSGPDQRMCGLRALVSRLAASPPDILVLERDDSTVEFDRACLFQAAREFNCPDLRYDHRRARDEPLLSAPDAIAWCWQRGGHWRRRVTDGGLVTHVHRL